MSRKRFPSKRPGLGQRNTRQRDVILDVIVRRGVDAVVLGSRLRTTTDKVYLGARLQRVFAEAPCSVLLLHVE